MFTQVLGLDQSQAEPRWKKPVFTAESTDLGVNAAFNNLLKNKVNNVHFEDHDKPVFQI